MQAAIRSWQMWAPGCETRSCPMPRGAASLAVLHQLFRKLFAVRTAFQKWREKKRVTSFWFDNHYFCTIPLWYPHPCCAFLLCFMCFMHVQAMFWSLVFIEACELRKAREVDELRWTPLNDTGVFHVDGQRAKGRAVSDSDAQTFSNSFAAFALLLADIRGRRTYR